MPVKYVFVTGGVVSGLGKGITAASLGRLLKARGYTVTMQKFDPYINIDPGTMNPVQHGEVFVTDDGAETDLDLGHYERFIDESLTRNSNVTTGKVYWSVLQRERRGDYGGGTVQVIPHITNEIKDRFYRNFTTDKTEIAIIEVGGTVVRLLDATPRRGIVTGYGQTNHGTVRQVDRTLYQSLTECAAPYYHTSVPVLNGPGHDFAGRSGVLVHQYDEASVLEVARTFGKEITAARSPSFGVDNEFFLLEKLVGKVDGGIQIPSSVSLQVED